jgi:hypothetical protein
MINLSLINTRNIKKKYGFPINDFGNDAPTLSFHPEGACFSPERFPLFIAECTVNTNKT